MFMSPILERLYSQLLWLIFGTIGYTANIEACQFKDYWWKPSTPKLLKRVMLDTLKCINFMHSFLKKHSSI